MFFKVIGKISSRLKFLYRKQGFLNFSLRRLLCTALIQPHFDYTASAWYPNLHKNLKKKVQTAQNKCLRFCLSLDSRHHVGVNEFRRIKWLPIQERYEQGICSKVHNFYNNKAPSYMDEIFSRNTPNHQTRSSMHSLVIPPKRTDTGKNSISFFGPKCWNSLPADLKTSSNRNTFKHLLKENYFSEKT